MNEEFMERWGLVIVISITLILFGAGLSGSFYYIVKTRINSGNEACQEIGYEEYIGSKSSSLGYCKDSKGDFHYVEVTLKGGLSLGIDEVKEVSVGDVRVLK